MSLINRLRRVGSPGRRGVAAIEFALWLPVLLLFVSAVIDWGSYMTTRVTVARAVMEGTRSGAAVFEPPTVVPPGSRIVNRTIARTERVFTDMGLTCSNPSCFQVQYCTIGAAADFGDDPALCTNPPIVTLVVEATLPFTPFFGLIPTPTDITETFEMAVESQ